MLITTTDTIPGKTIIETFGMARGTVVRARNLWRDFRALLRIIVGGEVIEYTALVAQSREQAVDRMTADARAMGANAIVGFRFATCGISRAAAEVMAYGTAVRIKE
ncbi:MAG: heavy metal-binding domain-containing protein [Planctomycetes bacterium]|nr:heavy metal-binding domain-containing protein [Planctomycetota bacterium]